MPAEKRNNEPTSSVFAALVGRPNVGKSSLTNLLVGEKVAIVTQKPQTTRNRITGVVTRGAVQYVFLDTPGIHKPRNRLDARMKQTTEASLADVDVTVMLFEPVGPFSQTELEMAEALKKSGPAVAVINKIDLLKELSALEARKSEIAALGTFDVVLPMSAQEGTGCEELFAALDAYRADGPHYFPDDAYTDMPEKELVSEIIREKALLYLRDEVPHGIAVQVISFKERADSDLVDISAEIYCERKSHKGMIIGKGGQMLKKIGTAARADCENMLGVRVNLQCWVKVKEDWRDSENQLNALGFAKP
jgi:GTP-binding protein Era